MGAAVALVFLRGRVERFRAAWVVRCGRPLPGAVCLGPVIIVGPHDGPDVLAHEYGHFLQHLVLGPAYHLVVGLPSLAHAVWWEARGRRGSYFRFYTEAWADDWGGVYSDHPHTHPHWRGYLPWPLHGGRRHPATAGSAPLPSPPERRGC